MAMKLLVPTCAAILMLHAASGCTNLLVTPGASAEGTSTISYMADTGALFGTLGHYPPTNEFSRTTYDWDSGAYLGVIPGFTENGTRKETYNVIANTNEHGLSIGETTFGGNATLAGGPGLLSYGSVIWVTLQRAKTAREAITVMDQLMQADGYTSDGESFSVADPNEVWIMEVVGKGPQTKGSVWVAKRIPDGYVSAHANQARIRAPLVTDDPTTCR
jgi:dipeptidase